MSQEDSTWLGSMGYNLYLIALINGIYKGLEPTDPITFDPNFRPGSIQAHHPPPQKKKNIEVAVPHDDSGVIELSAQT